MVSTAARVFGIIYILVGILGFVPGISPPVPADVAQAHPLLIGLGYNNVLGLFTVNAIHDLVHILVGIWALVAAASIGASRSFFRSITVVFVLLVVLGIIPATATLFGLAPLFGADVLLHVLTAVVAAYLGWGAATTENRTAI